MKIVVADDHDMVRESLSLYVKSAWSDSEVLKASDFITLRSTLESNEGIDLIICDYVMPGMEGLSGVKTLFDSLNGKPLVMISGLAAMDDVIGALRIGASGFLFKTMSSSAIVMALRLVMVGEIYVPPAVLDMVPDNSSKTLSVQGEAENLQVSENLIFEKLTEREREILLLLTEGLTNKDIARRLKLQEITVKVHLKHVFRKLDVANRTQASNMALKLGFVAPR